MGPGMLLHASAKKKNAPGRFRALRNKYTDDDDDVPIKTEWMVQETFSV